MCTLHIILKQKNFWFNDTHFHKKLHCYLHGCWINNFQFKAFITTRNYFCRIRTCYTLLSFLLLKLSAIFHGWDKILSTFCFTKINHETMCDNSVNRITNVWCKMPTCQEHVSRLYQINRKKNECGKRSGWTKSWCLYFCKGFVWFFRRMAARWSIYVPVKHPYLNVNGN